MLNETERLTKLTNDLLALNNLSSHGMLLDKVDFDINRTIRETVATFEGVCREKNLGIDLILTDDKMIVNADETRIQQVLYNLIDNAVKFCPSGGTLGLRITQTKRGKYLVAVSNTGPTIPAEELPLVFDRFHKTDKSRSVDRDGWGLGLYIVKTIVLSHGEDVYVTSRDGVTEFSFTMPRTNP